MLRTAEAKVTEIVAMLRKDSLGIVISFMMKAKVFSSAKCPDQLWGTSSLLCC